MPLALLITGTLNRRRSALTGIRNFNLLCWLFGHSYKELKPLYSLRIFKETKQSVKVGAICECKNCGLQINKGNFPKSNETKA